MNGINKNLLSRFWFLKGKKSSRSSAMAPAVEKRATSGGRWKEKMGQKETEKQKETRGDQLTIAASVIVLMIWFQLRFRAA